MRWYQNRDLRMAAGGAAMGLVYVAALAFWFWWVFR
jgi:hypothetical protein